MATLRFSLRQLKLFSTKAKAESTSAAAEEAALSQSAVSAAVNELEQTLGVGNSLEVIRLVSEVRVDVGIIEGTGPAADLFSHRGRDDELITARSPHDRLPVPRLTRSLSIASQPARPPSAAMWEFLNPYRTP